MGAGRIARDRTSGTCRARAIAAWKADLPTLELAAPGADDDDAETQRRKAHDRTRDAIRESAGNYGVSQELRWAAVQTQRPTFGEPRAVLMTGTEASVNNRSSAEAKIALFRSLFRGRYDVYRRDRRKDLLLQENGYVVLRFLAEDVGKHVDEVLDAILRTLSHRGRER